MVGTPRNCAFLMEAAMRFTMTQAQRDVFDFIREYHATHGFSPTVREISKARGVAVNCVMGHLRAIQRKGWIRRSERVARSIVVLTGE